MSEQRPEPAPDPASGAAPAAAWRGPGWAGPSWRETLAARLPLWRGWLAESGSLRVFLLYLPGPGPLLMSWLRKRWVLWRNPHCRIEFRGPVYLGPGFSLHAPHGGSFIAGPGCEFRRGFRAELGGPEARIEIGTMTVFTYDVVVQCSSRITIGAHCIFAQASTVVDGNHNFRDPEHPVLQQGYALTPITVADHVFVAAKVTVIADVATRTVVGANSVVTRPLPSYCVAAGAPARVLEYFGPPGQEPEGLAAPLPR